MWEVSYWVFPLVSSIIWLAMLLAMFLSWIVDGQPQYSSFSRGQNIAYISDIGADRLKPLFIAMGTTSVVIFDIVFVAERWLRHKGRLAANTSVWQKALTGISIFWALAGGLGLILLTIFDTRRHHNLHDVFLVLFIGGYIISAIFICWEYQRLGMHYRQYRILRASFWIKLTFIFIEAALAVAFATLGHFGDFNKAAIIEWVIALVYTFYVMSFFMDFIPAVRTKGHQSRETEEQMAHRESVTDYDGATVTRSEHADREYTPGRHYANGNMLQVGTNGARPYSYGTNAYASSTLVGNSRPASTASRLNFDGTPNFPSSSTHLQPVFSPTARTTTTTTTSHTF